MLLRRLAMAEPLFQKTSNVMPDNATTHSKGRPGLKKIEPYWYPYRTNAKARWFDREILEIISTEIRDRSVEYYVGETICASMTSNDFLRRDMH